MNFIYAHGPRKKNTDQTRQLSYGVRELSRVGDHGGDKTQPKRETRDVARDTPSCTETTAPSNIQGAQTTW